MLRVCVETKGTHGRDNGHSRARRDRVCTIPRAEKSTFAVTAGARVTALAFGGETRIGLNANVRVTLVGVTRNFADRERVTGDARNRRLNAQR